MSTEILEIRNVSQGNPEGKRLGRRGFLAAASGLTLGFFLPDASRLGEAEAATVTTFNSWLTIGSDNTITLTIGSSEMGQGSFSGLAQILAEDLVVDYTKIVTVQGGPSLTSTLPGTAINTVGSGVIRNNFWKMRDAGTAARLMLVQAAMNRQGDATAANYTVSKGVITHTPSGKTYTYGDVALDASKLAVPVGQQPVIPDSQFQVIGKTVNRVDIPSKTNGSAVYGIDIRLPGMLYAVVRHCPTFGGTLNGTVTKPQGMTAVVPLQVVAGADRGTETVGSVNAVAVVGPNTWDTWRAANGLNVKWTIPAAAAKQNDAQFVADGIALLGTGAKPYAAGAANGAGTLYTVEGNAATSAAAIAGAAKTVDAIYTLPYVAHACMEVLNCTVSIVNGKVDIYAPTQSAKSVLSLFAPVSATLPKGGGLFQLTGITADNVTVHTTYLGGGLGRKAEVDFVSQAVQVAFAVKQPVKLMWPREQDFTRDQYRPMAVVHAKAGLDSAGNVAGWAYRNVSPSILGQRGAVLGATGDSQGSEGSQALPYNLGAFVTEWVSHPSTIPVGFWRSVGASINTFAVESMIDELAVAAGQGKDCYLFRHNLLKDSRWQAVLDAAAKLGNWYAPLASGHGRGIAIGTAFNSIVAEVVEVSNVKLTGTGAAATVASLTVNSVSIALDCWIAVNPGQLEAQMTGGMVHGLNAALYGSQSFVAGAAQKKNFSHSRMIRPSEMPQVAVTLLPSQPSSATRPSPVTGKAAVNIGGAGELGVPTLAPALANAIYRACGVRVRTLPLFPNATMSD